ncbi:MAG: hypothetical protein L0I68_01755 [Lacticaseibacillus paracasei]|uniref:hypothetical protein n=1 Tax=Enterococcus sp. TaxID=35783 RepID=UPI002647A676|nr:hypothetical protein [Enterococcus sp.]MDN6103239.1 hypothetical protein [Lacticaseibacillus paracasei]MDN6515158.1 hypothetical protein [Lacticaseibacillus paracasei]MDN6650244.1 hypothetical protein [Enterococcus sp.]
MEGHRWRHWLLPLYAVLMTALMVVGWYRWSDSQSVLQETKTHLNAITGGESKKVDKRVLVFADLVVGYRADQQKRHDQIEKLSTKAIADQIVPPANIGKAGVGPDLTYKVTYQHREVTYTQAGSETIAMARVAYTITSDGNRIKNDLVLRLPMKQQKIIGCTLYRLNQSQASHD